MSVSVSVEVVWLDAINGSDGGAGRWKDSIK